LSIDDIVPIVQSGANQFDSQRVAA
jgi:hypothetical protein